ncbi:MAG: LruC domain-containing protein [Sphingobacteriales bacterium]|nr:MAG: LruC domain-containing protein [Sphingobacteriales bacterium]
MKKLLLALIIVALATACKKNRYDVAEEGTQNPTAIAPIDFKFATTKKLKINLTLKSNNDQPIKGVLVSFYSNKPNNTEPLLKQITDVNGNINVDISVPAYTDTLIIDPKYVGLMRNAKAVITNNGIDATIGGKNGYSGSIVKLASNRGVNKILALDGFFGKRRTLSSNFEYLGTYDNDGVPNYLEAQSDTIGSRLLSYINASLPESQNVSEHHPQYLQSGTTVDLNIVSLADVWITFVSEGAGYQNSLGFYTYPTGNPPQSEADISNIKYIFPNASLPNDGGNLPSGSKVNIGRFTPGTSIGFVVLANAWDWSTQTVDQNSNRFYTTSACNPETDNELKKHSVLLFDDILNIFLIGMDDQNREQGSDNDLNDILFYASSNPVTAISDGNVRLIDTPTDTDGDGVTDTNDEFPTDSRKAYTNYYPSRWNMGTLLFEDLWPATGDYDLNDMVVGYKYKYITNGQNAVTELEADYIIKAVGASYINGFGVEFPFASSLISNVTGQRLISNYITRNANGTEQNQTKAVIIPFDDYNALIKRPGGFYINTENSANAPKVASETAHIVITFNNPISASVFGTPPFNPFLISNKRRGYEVHLPGKTPTNLATPNLFNTLQDNSQPGIGLYYKSKDSWPWALDFMDPFDYPSEGNAINKAYTHFLEWARTGGNSYPDWYLNTGNNRNNQFIYNK